MSSQYEDLGIDAHKNAVKQIFTRIIDNDHSSAFCNIVEDYLDPNYAMTQHMDGDGSKFIQRILHYKETGDETVFQGAVDDAISMNTSDIAASGFVKGYAITDVININGANVPKDLIMEQIAIRFEQLKTFFDLRGIRMQFLGGETADLPDQVKSIVFDIAVSSRILKTRLITGNVQAGDTIFGMASDGQARWETESNSGIMSNGLTMARIKLMSKEYNDKYPELMRAEKPYEGRFLISDYKGLEVSKAIMSPTRQWAGIIKMIIDVLIQHQSLHLLHGIVINTGGGASKILNIGQNICYKKTMPSPPDIFQLIQRESGEEWQHMFTSFNCGVGIDLIGSDKGNVLTETLKLVSHRTDVKYFNLGVCEHSENQKNEVELTTKYGTFHY